MEFGSGLFGILKRIKFSNNPRYFAKTVKICGSLLNSYMAFSLFPYFTFTLFNPK